MPVQKINKFCNGGPVGTGRLFTFVSALILMYMPELGERNGFRGELK